MKRLKSIRWTIEQAASEFKINPRTLSSRIKTGGIEAGDDGRYSTLDICRATYGDYEGERLRDKRLDADLKELDKTERLRQLLPAELVARVWDAAITDLKTKISYLDIPDDRRQEMLADLRSIPIDDYFATPNQGDEEPVEEGIKPA